MTWGVERRVKPVFTILVSSNKVHSVSRAEPKNDVITFRTWLCADVRASLNLGQTQAKCVRDSMAPLQKCRQIGDRAFQMRLSYDWTGHIPVMHLSHILYWDCVQRQITLDIILPSSRSKRSVTKTVVLFRTARRTLEPATFSKILRLGALSQGKVLSHSAVNLLISCRTRSQKDPYFWDQDRFQAPQQYDLVLLVHLLAHSGDSQCGF